MKLRDYQEKAITDINEAWIDNRNLLYVLPCRGGKTVIFADAILNNIGGSVAIAHRSELVYQMSCTLARNDVQHRVIGASELVRECTRSHLKLFGRNFVNVNSKCAIASVDTLVRMNEHDPWFKSVTLWVCDEGHHLSKKNKWHRAVEMFPNAKGLAVTATPLRGDGAGLGHNQDGVIHKIIHGPRMSELEARGYLAPYRIFAPMSVIDMSDVNITATGDYSPTPLRNAVHKSHITGNVVKHYLKIAPGKLGITFCVDVAAAVEMTRAYINAGVNAATVTAETSSDHRIEIQRKHQAGEILQLVNVDLYGEGVDIPNLEVVSMARPTASFALFYQQFCRPLNPIPGKTAIIIDHVGNVARHSGAWVKYVVNSEWSLDRADKRSRSVDIVLIRTCPECLAVYERIIGPVCPFCNYTAIPARRDGPEFVDGDLQELDFKTMKALRGAIDKPLIIPHNATHVVEASVRKNHRERQAALEELQAAMLDWSIGKGDTRTAQRLFYITFGVDVLSAQAGNKRELNEIRSRITNNN